MNCIKHTLIICILLLLAACNSGENTAAQTDTAATTENNRKDSAIIQETDTAAYMQDLIDTSTYDQLTLTDAIAQQQQKLEDLSRLLIFKTLQSKQLPSLSKKQQLVFTSKSVYELLYFVKGDLFQNRKEDYAFVVYDKEHRRISILTYNELSNEYLELYRGIKVSDDLKKTDDCNYGSFGTLDYQIADEIVYEKDDLIKDPESFFENIPCKLVNIFQDEDFVLEAGCFSSSKEKEDTAGKSLCIATSYVYNNWECLKYDKANKLFHIFYGQAFAD